VNKIKVVQLDDILLMPRNGELPLQVVRQSLLGGLDPFAGESDWGPRVIPIHAGVPCSIKTDSGDPVHHWMTSEKFGELVQARKQAFQEKGGPGVPVSTTLLANHLGTQAGAAAAVEHAATVVWKAHVSSQGSTIVSKNESVLFHERDLAIFKEMLERGKISNLARRQNDYWSTAKRQKHRKASEKGAGCKEGPMTGTDRQKHREASEKGGASKKGPMTETAMEEHLALMAQGYTQKHRLMMQLANGKEGQENVWNTFFFCSIPRAPHPPSCRVRHLLPLAFFARRCSSRSCACLNTAKLRSTRLRSLTLQPSMFHLKCVHKGCRVEGLFGVGTNATFPLGTCGLNQRMCTSETVEARKTARASAEASTASSSSSSSHPRGFVTSLSLFCRLHTMLSKSTCVYFNSSSSSSLRASSERE